MPRHRTAPASGAAALDSSVMRLGHAGTVRGVIKVDVSDFVECDMIHPEGRPALRVVAVLEGCHKFTHCTEVSMTLYEADIAAFELAIQKLRERKEKPPFQANSEESASASAP